MLWILLGSSLIAVALISTQYQPLRHLETLYPDVIVSTTSTDDDDDNNNKDIGSSSNNNNNETNISSKSKNKVD